MSTAAHGSREAAAVAGPSAQRAPGADRAVRAAASVAPLLPMPPQRPTRTLRALDITVSLVLLVLLSPLLLLLAALVCAMDGRPVLFCQRRMGEGAREFRLYKFRTMRHDAQGPALTAGHDPRVTRLGRRLRGFHLDELPQLWNVLRGDMTLVGPRPEPSETARRYPPECHWLFSHRPGLTGPCQLRSRAEAALFDGCPDPEAYYIAVLVPLRDQLNAELLARRTPTVVAGYLIRTLWYVVSAVWDKPGTDSLQIHEEGRS
ncbi:sugar transferase [Streptomyces sp. RG80]|uniref:sugar transferase n=1 Tax=Streptomyces sp. RG80 TaxID=3157340 RepID=UPI00338EF0FF